MPRFRLPMAVAAGLALLGAAACGTDDAQTPAGDGSITVTANDTECAVARTSVSAGTSVFKITNNGSKINEFYVYAEGDRVMGEIENIGPGLTRELHVELPAGTYQTACKPGMSGKGIRAALTVTGSTASNNKGINLPGVAVNVPALSEKDEDDLRWGLRLGVDLIALSFVRNADDIVRVHEIMAEEGIKLPVIAKIEKPQAVDNLEAIIDAFDSIMVARGDLGVELPLEAVPIVQKRAVELSRRMAKPVIVATQMLESMISSPVPTRAETSDVANAVLDGADAVMLSGETSVGEYPVITVQTMARIVESTEEHGLERIPPLGTKPRTQGGAITLAAAEVADFVDAKYVCVFTETGDAARRMSRLRFRIPMKAFTPHPEIRRRMSLFWGIESFLVEPVTHTDAMFKQVDEILMGNGLAEVGDKVVVISGSPPGLPGSTNDLRVHVIGDAANAAAPAYRS